MNEGECEVASEDGRKSDVKQDLFATSCCNKLTLLLSQCSAMQYMQRIKILIQLIHYWKQNIDVSITIIQKDSMQQSHILLKEEEPCIEECQQMEEKMCEDIYQQDEDFQFDQHSSQYLTFDAIQNSSNASVDASSSAVLILYDSGSSTFIVPEKTVSSDNKCESIAKITPALPDGIEIGLESNTLRHLCGICGSRFNSIVDRNKHLRAYHLDKSDTKKKSALPGPNEIVKVDQPKRSSRSSISKANVSHKNDNNKISVSKSNVNNRSGSTRKMSLDKNGLDCIGKTSACKTSSFCSNRSATSLNSSSESKVSDRKNSAERLAKSVRKTSSGAHNKLSKKSKTVRSGVNDTHSNQLCELNNDCDDSNDDNNQESEDVVESRVSDVNSNSDSLAAINKDGNSNDCYDKEKQLSCKLKKGEIISCIKCNRKFQNKACYEIHIVKCYSKNLKIVIPQKPYKCSICPLTSYASRNNLKNHMLIYHNVTDPLPEYENGGYSCELCDKRYENKRSLQSHLHDHDPAAFKPFECSTCGMRFKHKSRLKSHNLVHTGERPHKCTMCDKAYQQQHDLKRHIQLVHLNDKQYICSVCGNDFVTTTLLKYHMRVHSGEKPHKCDICNKSFRIPRQLHVHKYIHRNYMAFVCKVCGAQFKAAGTLRRHSLLHSNKRPHTCSICGKDFLQPGNLRVHMRVHSGERPYVCGVCGMSFPHSGTWKKHEETHK